MVVIIFDFNRPMQFIKGPMSSLIDAQLDLMMGTSHLINSKNDQV